MPNGIIAYADIDFNILFLRCTDDISLVQIKDFLSRIIMNKFAEPFLTKSVTADSTDSLHTLLHIKVKSLKRQITAFYGDAEYYKSRYKCNQFLPYINDDAKTYVTNDVYTDCKNDFLLWFCHAV